MWGNPTLFYQDQNQLKKILRKDNFWQKLLAEKVNINTIGRSQIMPYTVTR